MNQQSYRVLSRKLAAVIGALLLAAAAVIVWFVLQKMRASTADLGVLYDQSPEQAAIEVVRRVRIYAWLFGGSLFAIAAWIAWMASRIIRTARMPPPGSWIVEGQRTWEGDTAIKRGRYLGYLAGALALLAVGLFVMLWKVAGSIAVPVK
jgi:hypothetical protein